jgi:predicted nucleic acid-binding Zn ribbon protein
MDRSGHDSRGISGGAPRRRAGYREPRRPRPRPTKVERHGPADPPEGIGSVVRDLLGDRRMRRGMALGRLARSWPQVVGEELGRHTAPRALEGGGLVVAAASAAWGSQVRFLAREVRRRANEVLGVEEVRSVRVTVVSEAPKSLRRNGNRPLDDPHGPAGEHPSGW